MRRSENLNIIEVKGLEKSYGNLQAVKGIDFYVEKGKMFSFLGPNGAGKSTTIDIICTFLKHDSGSVIIDGYEVGKDDESIRALIGAVFQDSVLDGILTVEDNLKARGSLYGMKGATLRKAVKDVVNLTGINDYLNRQYGRLSGGQRRRCDIARALIHTPKILFLDEPTTGLDPQTRKNIWETIGKIQKKTNMTIFLTTHYMEEAAESNYIVVMDSGEIIAKGTPADIKQKYSHDRLILTYKDLSAVKIILDRAGQRYNVKASEIEIKIKATEKTIELVQSLKPYISSFEVIKGTIDDAFINITGKEIRE